MNVLYTTRATATGDGRNGHTATEDGLVDLDSKATRGNVEVKLGVI